MRGKACSIRSETDMVLMFISPERGVGSSFSCDLQLFSGFTKRFQFRGQARQSLCRRRLAMLGRIRAGHPAGTAVPRRWHRVWRSGRRVVAAVMCLAEGKPMQRIWQQCYFWSFPYYLVGACASALMITAAESII